MNILPGKIFLLHGKETVLYGPNITSLIIEAVVNQKCVSEVLRRKKRDECGSVKP
jgi:hypothetical protein